jgi:hypothetical protein
MIVCSVERAWWTSMGVGIGAFYGAFVSLPVATIMLLYRVLKRRGS